MVMDGSWGVLLQDLKLSEEEFRGERLAGHDQDIRGCIDALSITRPDIIVRCSAAVP